MNLTLFLLLVFTYLIVIDIRLAWIKLFVPKSRRQAAVHRQGVLGSRWILYWGERLIGLKVRRAAADPPLPDQFVLVANHQSLLDILVVLAFFPHRPVRFVAKKELGRFVPGASRVLRYGRHALINRRHNLRETANNLKRFASRCRSGGWSPVIFPEGTRSRDGKLKKFHPGAYRFVQEPLRLPTAVAVIDGGSKYSHFKDFLRKNEYSYRIQLLRVLPPPGGSKQITADLAEARDIIAEQLDIWHRGDDAIPSPDAGSGYPNPPGTGN
jgi:1-acyl-sn-glycerol-3-phosphate acyltransferase